MDNHEFLDEKVDEIELQRHSTSDIDIKELNDKKSFDIVKTQSNFIDSCMISDLLLKRFPKYIRRAIWYVTSDEIIEKLIDEAVYTLYNKNEIWNDINFIKNLYSQNLNENYCVECVNSIYNKMNDEIFFETFIKNEYKRGRTLNVKLKFGDGISKQNIAQYKHIKSESKNDDIYYFNVSQSIQYDKFSYKITKTKGVSKNVNKLIVTHDDRFEWGYYNKFSKNKKNKYIRISLSNKMKYIKRHWNLMSNTDNLNENTKNEMNIGLINVEHLNIIYALCQYYYDMKSSLNSDNILKNDKTPMRLIYVGPYNDHTLMVRIKIKIDGKKYLLRYWNARNNNSTNAFVITKITEGLTFDEYLNNPNYNDFNEDINTNYYVYFRTKWSDKSKEPKWEYYDNGKFVQYTHNNVIKQLELTFQASIYENFPHDLFPFDKKINDKEHLCTVLTELTNELKDITGHIYMFKPIFRSRGTKQFIVAMTQVGYSPLNNSKKYDGNGYARNIRRYMVSILYKYIAFLY